jgi:uncharacterized protein YraI
MKIVNLIIRLHATVNRREIHMNVKRFALLMLSVLLLAMMVVPVTAQTPTPVPGSVADTDFYVEAFRRVNVRSGPGVRYTRIGSLNAGDTADITGRADETNSWLRIDFNGQEGWVSITVVEVTGDPDSAPVVEPGPNAVLRTTAAQSLAASQDDVVVVTRVNANMRASSNPTSDVVGVIPFGTRLEPNARSEGNNRIRVIYNGVTGWVSVGLVNITDGNINTLPVAE